MAVALRYVEDRVTSLRNVKSESIRFCRIFSM